MVGSVTSVGGAGNTAPTTSGASKTTKVGQIEGAAPDGWHLPSASEAGGCLPVRFWSIETPKQTQPRWSLAPLLVSLNAPLTGCPPRLYPSDSPWLSADVASERLSDPFRTAEAPQALSHLSLPRAGRSRCVSCIVKDNPKMDHSGDAREMHRDRLDHLGRGRGGCASASRPVAIAASARSPHGRAGCDRGDTRSDTGAGSIDPALPGVRVPHGS